MDLTSIGSWLSKRQGAEQSIEALLEEIDSAVADFSRIFPPPYSLAPNLALASDAASALRALIAERRLYSDAVGLPASVTLEQLISHHRANAALGAAFESLRVQGTGAEPLSDEEWRALQSIPDQGYSHRGWIDHKIALRVAAAAPSEDGTRRG